MYSERSTLNLVISTVLILALIELALTVARIDVRIPPEVLKVDPSLYSQYVVLAARRMRGPPTLRPTHPTSFAPFLKQRQQQPVNFSQHVRPAH